MAALSPSSSSGPSPASTLTDNFPKGKCALDDSRTLLLQEQTKTLESLAAGKLKNQNRFRRLLLGRKGVGKTTFLQGLLEAAHTTYGSKLLTQYISYATSTELLAVQLFRRLETEGILPTLAEYLTETNLERYLSPEALNLIKTNELSVYKLLLISETQARAMKFSPGAADHIATAASFIPLFARISAWLAKHGKFLFLVVDELQNVFTGSFHNGDEIIRELLALGDNQDGRIHCILSGSSTNLRQLAFAEIPMTSELVSHYPNYKAVDLNSTKFQACWIYPFLDADSSTCGGSTNLT